MRAPVCVRAASYDNIAGFIPTGEVPGLHSQEELEPLLSPLKELMREDGNHKTTYDFFVSRVQKNLHVALCMVRYTTCFQCRGNTQDDKTPHRLIPKSGYIISATSSYPQT